MAGFKTIVERCAPHVNGKADDGKLATSAQKQQTNPVSRCFVVGGQGKIGEFIVPFLPTPEVAVFDLKEIRGDKWPVTRLARNITRANIVGDNFLDGERDKIRQIVVLAVPEILFAAANRLPYGRRAKLHELLGTSGAGRSQTLVLFVNSVHQHAANILEKFSGPTVGVHLLFRPGPDLVMSQQTAVITVTDKKRSHHFWKQAEDITRTVLTRIGIGNIVTMSPIAHDQLMADVQFLSHSLFLLLADSYSRLPCLPPHPLISAVQNSAQRILRGQPHVYAGIARDNPANGQLFAQWCGRLRTIIASDIITVTRKVIAATEDVSAVFGYCLGRNLLSVSTPISRARKQLTAMISEPFIEIDKPLLDITPSLETYAMGLQSEQSYGAFFNTLAGKCLHQQPP